MSQHPCRWPAAAARRMGRSAGWSAVELLVVIGMAAALLSVAVPAFAALVKATRFAAQIHGFAGDLQFARAQALIRGYPVSVCASTDGASCAAGGAWPQGWIVFADRDGDRVPGRGDSVLHVRPAWTGTDTFTADNGATALGFDRHGYLLGLDGNVTLTLNERPANASAARCLTLNLAGEQHLHQGAACLQASSAQRSPS